MYGYQSTESTLEPPNTILQHFISCNLKNVTEKENPRRIKLQIWLEAIHV